MDEIYLRKCSISLDIREMKMRTTLRFHFTLIRMATIKNIDDSLSWRGCGIKGIIFYYWLKFKLVQPLWKLVWWFLRKLKDNLPQDPEESLLVYTQRMLIITQRYLLNYVHKIIFHNSQILEITEIHINKRMDLENVVHLHNGVVHCGRK